MFVAKLSSALAAAAVIASSAPAIAGSAKERVAMEVAYGDLDLVSRSGEKRLLTRVRMAAASVCGNPGSNSLSALRSFEECRSGAIDQAAQDVARAVAAARNGGPAYAAASQSITVRRAVAER